MFKIDSSGEEGNRMIERDEIQVGPYVLTTQENNELEAFQHKCGVTDDEAQEIIGSIRGLGSAVDYQALQVTKRILDATKEREEMDLKEKLRNQTEKLAASEFMRAHPEFQPSLAAQTSYKQFAAKHGLTEMSPQSLEGWWANHRQDFLPKPPAPPPPPPDTRPKLPPTFGQYEFLTTSADVWRLSVDELRRANAIPLVAQRIKFILANKL